ncbi:hypothetical protein Aph02nite_32230 [Actinoplanes philippinensis]|uniref:Uncharacterized protein n=1 Tax=Actinoplanes philippinensis TaxID=35752 RepID=A0A1I2E5E8_9ACTN|nr:hypothetical protein [Actinoplanes philippinensis]GIE77273.1 hypothetical protein Aph02nite_32230 [Actinoplanes philippinensis]SFE87731.1 hypothetical protein SAMN05421541_104181 [Actinoplanes philippinensis]
MKTKHINVAFVVLAAVVLAGVAYGVDYLWDKRFGPTAASAADCRLAQELIDKAQNPPSDAAEGEKWEQQIRQIRYTRLENDGISTEVGKYVHWSMVRATGDPARPPAGTLEEMTELAIGHCEDSGVELRVPKIVF